MSEQVIANVFNIFQRAIAKAGKPAPDPAGSYAEPEPDHMESEYAAPKADIPQPPTEPEAA